MSSARETAFRRHVRYNVCLRGGTHSMVREDKFKLFISYSRDDLKFADQLDTALNITGYDCTIDRQGIQAGEDWKHRLGSLILEADTVIFVLSPTSAVSKVCAWEVEEVTRCGKRILPVLCRPLDGAQPPTRLSDLNFIYFYDEPKVPGSGFGSGLAQLISAISTDSTGCGSIPASCKGQQNGRWPDASRTGCSRVPTFSRPRS